MKNIILAADIGGTTCKLGIFNGELEQLHNGLLKQIRLTTRVKHY